MAVHGAAASLQSHVWDFYLAMLSGPRLARVWSRILMWITVLQSCAGAVDLHAQIADNPGLNALARWATLVIPTRPDVLMGPVMFYGWFLALSVWTLALAAAATWAAARSSSFVKYVHARRAFCSLRLLLAAAQRGRNTADRTPVVIA